MNVHTINWKQRYGRNNQTYRVLVSVCYMVIKGLLQTTSDGTTRLMDFLDEQRMCRLYEKFILEYYRRLPLNKEDFLAGIRRLHIGEWRTHYDIRRFGYDICDGTQWELEIYFSDGHKPVRISGNNSYPYNFDSFLNLIGMDPMEEEEDIVDDD